MQSVSGIGRIAALGAVIGAIVLVAIVLFSGGGGGYTVRAQFVNAAQLVKGNEVQVAGTNVGSIQDIAVTPDGQAEVEFTVNEDYAPLREGTTAVVRQFSLSGIANRYVELSPGPNSAPEIEDGGRLGVDTTSAPVDIDQLFNTLDPDTRAGLQKFITGQADNYRGKAPEAAESLKYLSPALSTTSKLTEELIADDVLFERFLIDTSRAVGAIAERRGELTQLVGNANTAFGAIGDENEALSRALGLLPTTLRKANTTFVNLRAALNDVDKLVAESKPNTKELDTFFARLKPLVTAARPTVRDLNVLVRSPGKNNDLINLQAKLPRLERLTSSAFPRAIRTFDRSQDFVDTLRSYTPDLAGWFTKFGQAASSYDANGHYARVQPIFSPMTFDESTNNLTKKPDSQRLDEFQLRQFRRCPGGATQASPDGSAPFEVEGCDPASTPDSDTSD
jgi:phospholipid/cholesterol/gamma-HCH transport system substrate-binding protein